MKKLEKYRKELDQLDKELIDILMKRFIVNKNIKKYKQKKNLKIYDEAREKILLEQRKQYAKKIGISVNFVEFIFINLLNFIKRSL